MLQLRCKYLQVNYSLSHMLYIYSIRSYVSSFGEGFYFSLFLFLITSICLDIEVDYYSHRIFKLFITTYIPFFWFHYSLSLCLFVRLVYSWTFLIPCMLSMIPWCIKIIPWVEFSCQIIWLKTLQLKINRFTPVHIKI